MLLSALLGSLQAGTAKHVFLDSRMQLDFGLPPDVRVDRVAPTIAGRLMAEWRLRRLARAGDIILCFGNLPPLFPSHARVLVYIQNRYHVNRRGLERLMIKMRYRLWFEHRWFDFGRRWVDEFIVQTPSMQMDIERRLGVRARVIPFVRNISGYSRRAAMAKTPGQSKSDFLYVATGEPHKNHVRLVEAWSILADGGYRPTLCLTLSPMKARELCEWIEAQKRKYDLRIEIAGRETESNLNELYHAAGALIYPSTFESFGLPLIEARQAGLPILAAELDYVRDLVDPEESFDPRSAISIARAVKRFMGRTSDELRIVDAATFIRILVDKV